MKKVKGRKGKAFDGNIYKKIKRSFYLLLKKKTYFCRNITEMQISASTKISTLIKENEGVIDVIASINKHFKKLQNPFLRKMLAPRVSIADAARVGGVPVCVMIDKLRDFGFEVEDACLCEEDDVLQVGVRLA